MRSFFHNWGGALMVVGGVVGMVAILAYTGTAWWKIVAFVLGVLLSAVLLGIANELWYTEGGKLFGAVPYPPILAFPTWAITRLSLPWFPPSHPWKGRKFTLRDWARCSTTLCRRIDFMLIYCVVAIGLLCLRQWWS